MSIALVSLMCLAGCNDRDGVTDALTGVSGNVPDSGGSVSLQPKSGGGTHEADIAMATHTHDEMFVGADEEIPKNWITTVVGITLTNNEIDDYTLNSLDFEFSWISGEPSAGTVKFLVYHDVEVDGTFAGLHGLEDEDIALQADPLSDVALCAFTDVASSVSLDLDEIQATEIPSSGTLRFGVLFYSGDIQETAELAVSITHGRATKDGETEEEEVPGDDEQTPVDNPVFIPEAPSCIFVCIEDQSVPVAERGFRLCYLKNVSWTEVNEFPGPDNTICPPDDVELCWMVLNDGVETRPNTCAEADTLYNGRTQQAKDSYAIKKVKSIAVTDPNSAAPKTDLLKEHSTVKPVDCNGAIVKATYRPWGKKHSHACDSTEVKCSVILCCNVGTGENATSSADATCKGTVIEGAVFPAFCCADNDCNEKLKDSLTASGVSTDTATTVAMSSPDCEDPMTDLENCIDGFPMSRIDPRNISDDADTGANEKTAAIAAINAAHASGIVSAAAGSNPLTECVGSACTTVCVRNGDSGAFMLRYEFRPGRCGYDKAKIVFSQFKRDGQGNIVAGDLGIQERDNFGVSDYPPASETRHDNHTPADPDNSIPESIGRDFEAGTPEPGTQDPPEDSGYINVRPTNDPENADAEGCFDCEYLLVSMCERPYVFVKICPLKELELKIRVNFPIDTGTSANPVHKLNNSSGSPINHGDITSITNTLCGRLQELFGQACIKVTCSPATFETNNSADNVDESGAAALHADNTGTNSIAGNCLNIYLVNTTNRGAAGAFHAEETAPGADGVLDNFIAIPMNAAASTDSNGDPEPNENLYAGDRIICTQIPAHEVGHALGLGEADRSSDTEDLPDAHGSGGTVTVRRRVMHQGAGGSDANEQPRFCYPTHNRFSCRDDTAGSVGSEIKEMRKKLNSVNNTGNSDSFTG